MDYIIRQATRSELDIAVEWAAREGWNPGLHDAQVFWDTDPHGFFVLEKDGNTIGSVSGVSYNGKFGFGGFFIIKSEYRNQKLGTELANYFVKNLSSRLNKKASIGIDGVFNMQPTYAKWGFKFSHRNLRMEGKGKGKGFDYTNKVSKVVDKDFFEIHALDMKCFGFDRKVFLRGWLKLPEGAGYKYVSGNKLEGYGVIRKCRAGYKIGPLFASKSEVADELFKALANYANGETIYLDIPEINPGAVKLAEKYGMKECFGCARMYYGIAPKLPYNQIYGVTTFELG